MTDDWNELKPDVWKPMSEGDQIDGIYVHFEPKAGDLSSRYFLDLGDNQRMIWGSKVLDERMSLAKIGERIRITFKGVKQLEKGRKLNLYTVHTRKLPDKGDTETGLSSSSKVL